MDQNAHNVLPLTAPSGKLPVASLKEQSLSTIQKAILSSSDDGESLRRAHNCLALYYDQDTDLETRQHIRIAFVKALKHLPAWAMHRAFDDWERTMQRRPSPADIVILAERAMKTLVDEIKRRQPQPDEAPRATPTPDEANRIMEAAGFTPKRTLALQAAPMATTFAEAETKASEPKNPHWSETADPNGPEWAALRASRAKNALMNPGAT